MILIKSKPVDGSLAVINILFIKTNYSRFF